jgi:amino acid permease
MMGAIFNLANTIIGSGVLAMPFACKQAGTIMFPVLLILTGLLANYAMYILFASTEKLQERLAAEKGDVEGREPLIGHDDAHGTEMNYPIMGRHLLGKRGELIASWAVTLQQIGACIAYIVIVADVLTTVMELVLPDGSIFAKRYTIQLIVVIVIIFPLTLLRKMDSLKYTSFLSLFFIISFILAVACTSAYKLTHDEYTVTAKPIQGEMQTGPDSFQGFFKTLPILCFAFLCHQNAFPIYNELEGASLGKMSQISIISMSICGSAYMLTAFFGYAVFKGDVDANLLKNYEVKGTDVSTLMDIVRVGFGLSFTFSYPIILFEARHNLDMLVFGDQPYSFKRYLCWNIGIVSLTLTVGILAPGIDVVLGLVGSTCSPMMVFVLPALFYLYSDEDPWSTGRKIPATMLLCWGVVLIPTCTAIWAMSAF